MNNKIRIGILGGADIANRLVIPNIIQTGKFDVVAVASRSIEKAVEFSEKFNCEAVAGYENLISRNDIDAIYIPLPTGMHYEWIINSLNAGKHVLCEKSLTLDINETTKIIELANEKKLCLFENFMFVFHSQFDFVKQQIKQGVIGDIRLLRSSFGFPPFSIDSNIRYKKELGGGAMLDAGAYTTMAVHFLLGQKQQVLASSLEKGTWEVDFQGSAMFRSESGIISQVAFGFDNYYQNNIELWGSKGKMTIERAFTAGPGFMPKIIIETQNNKAEITLPADNHFQKLLVKFAECIVKNEYDFLFGQMICQSSLLTQIKALAS